MILDADQRDVVRLDGNVAVQAPPGSGKTRTLVAKALRELKLAEHTPYSIACVTLSSAAASEVRERILSYCTPEAQERLFVSTIAGFALAEIFDPFHRKWHYYNSGYTLLTHDDPRYWKIAEDHFGHISSAMADQLRYARRTISGKPTNCGDLNPKKLRAMWSSMEERGYVDFPSLAFRSYELMESEPWLREAISAKYRWVLVDEFQDTTDIQLALLHQMFLGSHSSFFVIGDDRQAIYYFAGARVEHQNRFIEVIGAHTIQLSKNYRSTSAICALADALSGTRMEAVGSVAEFDDVPCVVELPDTKLWFDSKSYADAVRMHFADTLTELGISPASACVVAPQRWMAGKISSELESLGFPVSSEAARQYDSSLAFGVILQCVCTLSEGGWYAGMWGRLIRTLADTVFTQRKITVDEYEMACVAVVAVDAVSELAAMPLTACGAVEALAKAIEDAIGHYLGFDPKSVIANAAHAFKAWLPPNESRFKIADYRVHVDQLSVAHIHGVKGREYEAVAIVCAEQNFIPDYRNMSDIGLVQERNKIYVAITRAQKALRIYSRTGRTSEFVAGLSASGGISTQNLDG